MAFLTREYNVLALYASVLVALFWGFLGWLSSVSFVLGASSITLFARIEGGG